MSPARARSARADQDRARSAALPRAGAPVPPRAALPAPQRADLLALALAALAVAVRLPHLGWGLPGVEEEALPMAKALDMWGWSAGRLTLDPQTAGWPSLSFYVHLLLQHLHYAAGRALGAFADRNDYLVAYWLDKGPVLLLARGLSAALAGGVVYLGARLARRLAERDGGAGAGRGAAFLAGALLALSPLLVQYGQLVTPDILVALFAALAVTRIVDVHERGRVADYVWAGVFIGLGAASKYTPVLLLPGLFAAHVLRARRAARSSIPAALRDRRPWLGVLVAALMFCATSPYLVLNLGTLVRDVRAQAVHMTAGHFGQEQAATGVAHYVTGVLGPGLGWTGLVLSLAGLAWAAARLRGSWLVLAWCVLPFYLGLALLRTQFDRYMLPLLMPLAVGLGGIVLAARATPWPAPRNRKARAALAVALAALVLVPVALGALAYHRERAKLSTEHLANGIMRALAERERAYVIAEFLSISLPTSYAIDTLGEGFLARLLPRQRRRVLARPAYDVDYLPMYTIQPERSAVYYDLRHCRAHDYVVVSQAVRERYAADPARFPRETEFYRDLERFGTLVERVGPERGARGPEIRIYRLAPAGIRALLEEKGQPPRGFEKPYADRTFPPHFLGFFEGVARAAYNKGMWPTAAFYYQTLLDAAGGTIAEDRRQQLASVLAHARWRAGDLAEAERLYRGILARAPNDVRATASLAQVLEAQGKLDEARRAYEWCARAGAEAGSPAGRGVEQWARERLAELGRGAPPAPGAEAMRGVRP